MVALQEQVGATPGRRAAAGPREIALPRLESAFPDVGAALRHFRRNRSFFAAAVLILAFGIGATTAVFSVGETLLLRIGRAAGGRPLAAGVSQGEAVVVPACLGAQGKLGLHARRDAVAPVQLVVGAADRRQGDCVLVVRSTRLPLGQPNRLCLHLPVARALDPSRCRRLLPPPAEVLVAGKLLEQPAPAHEPSATGIDPVEESLSGGRPVLAEYFVHDVVVQDGAHLQSPSDRFVSSMKKRR